MEDVLHIANPFIFPGFRGSGLPLAASLRARTHKRRTQLSGIGTVACKCARRRDDDSAGLGISVKPGIDLRRQGLEERRRQAKVVGHFRWAAGAPHALWLKRTPGEGDRARVKRMPLRQENVARSEMG